MSPACPFPRCARVMPALMGKLAPPRHPALPVCGFVRARIG